MNIRFTIAKRGAAQRWNSVGSSWLIIAAARIVSVAGTHRTTMENVRNASHNDTTLGYVRLWSR